MQNVIQKSLKQNVVLEQATSSIERVFRRSGNRICFIDHGSSKRKPHLAAEEFNRPRVLHVDDDVDLVDAVTSRLKASGFRVACALDGVSGVQSALLFPTDAIILDYDMPNGRGDIVIDLLKSNEKTRDIPIVVLTAVHKRGLKRQLLSQGADVFMTKPFEFNELKQTISTLVDDSFEM